MGKPTIFVERDVPRTDFSLKKLCQWPLTEDIGRMLPSQH